MKSKTKKWAMIALHTTLLTSGSYFFVAGSPIWFLICFCTALQIKTMSGYWKHIYERDKLIYIQEELIKEQTIALDMADTKEIKIYSDDWEKN